MNACKHPLYAERYQRTKRRLGLIALSGIVVAPRPNRDWRG